MAPIGQVLGNETFLPQEFTVLYRRDLKGFASNVWIISLTSDQYGGAARFFRFPDYAKKLKNAIKNAGNVAVYLGQRIIGEDDYSLLYNQVAEQESMMQATSNNQLVQSADDDDDDYDSSGL